MSGPSVQGAPGIPLRLLGLMIFAAFVAPGSEDNLTIISWPGSTPAGLTNVTMIAAGDFHNLALKSDGTVIVWGDGATGRNAVPVGLSNVVAMSADYFSLVLKADSTVEGWGDNSSGQASVPVGLTNVIAVSAGGFHGLALKSDGTVENWGGNFNNQLIQPPGLVDIMAIDAGSYHSLALKSNGTVAAWGWNQYGQLNKPPGLSGVAAVSAGWGHNLALQTNGTVIGWGYNAYGQTIIPPGLSNVIAITAGFQHSVALKADGTVVAWGYNSDGQSIVPTGLSNVVAISAGAFHTLALMRSPGIAIHPENRSVFPGDDAAFSVTATGASPLSYQWQFNSLPIAGATNASFIATNVQQDTLGDYRVVVSNAYGSATSSNASLKFNQPPAIMLDPESQTVREMENVTFAVGAIGTAPLSFQWQLNGTNLSGATNSNLTLNSVHTTDTGLYSVIVSNVAGQVVSSNALLRVSATFIIDNPLGTVFGSWSSGSPRSATYHTNYLFKNQGTGQDYVQFTPAIVEPGNYQIHEFHPASTSHTTNAAHVVTFDGGTQTILVNQKTNGTKWNLLGAFILAAGTTGNLRITDAFPEPGQMVGADAIMFVKVLPPLIVAQPVSTSPDEGGNAQFTVKATATPPLTYQWRKDGTNILAATAELLVLTNVHPEAAGIYDVMVANSAGVAVSSNAMLTVRPRLRVARDSGSLILTWPDGFVLQTATNVSGPYADLPNALSPYTNSFEAAFRFFRIRP